MSRLSVLCTLLVISLLSPAPTSAETPTDWEMETVAQAWFETFPQDGKPGTPRATLEVEKAELLIGEDGVLGMVFGIRPAGYVVITASKDLPPVFAFSTNGSSGDAVHDGPCNHIRAGLQEALQDAEREGHNPATRAEWNDLLRSRDVGGRAGGTALHIDSGTPLMDHITWSQCSPWNNECPLMEDCGNTCIYNHRAPVGCVASSTSRLLRYWGHPDQGDGTHEYYWSGDPGCGVPGEILSANFNTLIDWAKLPFDCSTCTPEEEDSLAALCYRIGVGLNMDYGAGGSASTVIPGGLLDTHFRYAPTSLHTEMTSDMAWQIIRSEINARRPLLLGLLSHSHAVCIDGWALQVDGSRLVHINDDGGGTVWKSLDTFSIGDKFGYHIMPSGHVTSVVVHPDGSGDYATIQDAIDAVPEGHTVLLSSGEFTGVGNCDLDFGGKGITVRSQSGLAENTVIDCGGTSRGFYFHSGEQGNAVVQDLTITNGNASQGGAVLCVSQSTPLFINVIMESNSAVNGGAMAALSGSRPRLEGCILSENSATNLGSALYVSSVFSPITTEPTIVSCTIADNVGGGGAVYSTSGATVRLSNCIVAKTVNGASTACGFNGSVYYVCSDLWGNALGNWDNIPCISFQLGQLGNIEADPLFCDQSYELEYASPCADTECGWMGALEYCDGAAVVRSDGTGDFPTIQDAINTLGPGAIIELADAGAGDPFTGPGNIGLTINYAVTIRSQSQDPSLCLIDCDESDRFAETYGGGVLISGVTIKDGFVSEGEGGAISAAGDITISSCIFESNEAPGGGAVAVETCFASIDGCRFESNDAGNGGGGAILVNGLFGQLALDSQTNLFVANYAPQGGGAMQLLYGDAAISHCTFYDNTGWSGASALFVDSGDSNVQISHTIMAAGGGDRYKPAVGGNCSPGAVTASCTVEWDNAADWAGCLAGQNGQNGNFSADPLFCNPGSGDFRLQSGSPCLDAPGCGLIGAFGACSSPRPTHSLNDAGLLEVIGTNPARAYTVRFQAKQELIGSPLNVAVFDVAGRQIRTLYSGPALASQQLFQWDGDTDAGTVVGSGVYFMVFKHAHGKNHVERLLLIR